jgi:hypothetical protein
LLEADLDIGINAGSLALLMAIAVHRKSIDLLTDVIRAIARGDSSEEDSRWIFAVSQQFFTPELQAWFQLAIAQIREDISG